MNFKKILIEVFTFPFVIFGLLFTAVVNGGQYRHQKGSYQNSSFDDDDQQQSAFSEPVHEDDGDDGDDE